jgi:tetratricopeptide (TPR) repeat protein
VEGIRLGLSEKYPEAIAQLSKAVEEDPEHVIAHTSLGVAFHRADQDDRALHSYEAALKIDPTYAEAHYFRSNILYSRGNVREAITGYTRALGLKPELITSYEQPAPQDRLTDYTRAPAELHGIGRVARRILDLNKSLETDPRQAELFKERAGAYSRLWNYEHAIADYDSALALQPEDAGALHLRGAAYEEFGQRDQALEDYRQAMTLNPQISNEFIQRGVDFGRVGNFRQSVLSLTEGIRLAPWNPNGYFNRGTSYFQLGELEKAIADFSTVIQLAPEDEAAYYWRGISHEAAGHPSEAIADYQQFLELSQDADAREEIEERLSQWQEEKRDEPEAPRDLLGKLSRWVSRRRGVPVEGQKTDPVPGEQRETEVDLYNLIAALDERALQSVWLGSGVECYGESAEELNALTDQNQPIEGGDLLAISAGIRQTIAGDFHAFDPGASAHWLFLRAWEGSGFYIEINDPKGKERLKAYFPWVEDVEGAAPPYASLFIRT